MAITDLAQLTFLQSPPRVMRRRSFQPSAVSYFPVTPTDAAAFHPSLFAVWMVSPPSRRPSWARRLGGVAGHAWGANTNTPDPGALLSGGLGEVITPDKWCEMRLSSLPRWWQPRRPLTPMSTWIQPPAAIRLDFPSWMPFVGGVVLRAWARRRKHQDFLGQQISPVTPLADTLATTSFPLGDRHITGGSLTLE